MIARRAWWTATTKLSSNGISLMVKHDISSISSFYSTAIFKMAYFPASKRTRTSLVFKKDRKVNRMNQHWSICEASQQGKNMHFLLWVFYNPSCTSFIPQMLTVMYTLQSTITKTTLRACLQFISYSQHSGNEQIVNFEGCVLTFLLCSGFHCSCALPRSWRAIIISDNTWWLFGKRCVWMFACLQCTVCILNASSPCAPRVKKIRPIVGLLVVSVDTLRLEEASIYIDPWDAYISIFAREFEIVRVVLLSILKMWY